MSTLSDTSQSNIGWVYPPQPQTVVSTIEEVIGVVNGITPLVENQDYVDVVFGSEQPAEDWILLEVSIFNLTDSVPINVWPGVITSKTVDGFRLQLNGTPDSSNYYLSWSIRGVFGYYLSGPTSSRKNVASSPFTVSLPIDTTMTGSIVITPSDGGVGGSFTPSTVTLTADAPSATFTYTPTTYGARSISTTNNIGLVNPAQIGFTAIASEYTLDGPTEGYNGIPSTDFTVALPAGGVVLGTVTITPNDAADGGTFTPTSVNLTTAAPSATFTYTPASEGNKTISTTNNQSLTNPSSIVYDSQHVFAPTDIAGLKLWLKADALSLSNNDPVGSWTDSSGNGYHAVQATGSKKPLFKTGIINGKPAVRYDGVDDVLISPNGVISGITSAITIFVVQKTFVVGTSSAVTDSTQAAGNRLNLSVPYSDNNVYFDFGDIAAGGRKSVAWGGNTTDFFYWSFVAGSGNMAIYRNGTSISSGASTNNFTPGALSVHVGGTAFGGGGDTSQNADVVEIIIYNTALSTPDRQGIEAYIALKYAL